jgi:hypothetical protein
MEGEASAITKRLLPAGTKVQLVAEPAANRVDRYRRFLRYVIRARDGLKHQPVSGDDRRGDPVLLGWPAWSIRGAARPARPASTRPTSRAVGACPHTPYDPYRGVDTRR